MSDIQSASTSVESTSIASSSTESISAASTSTASTSTALASTSKPSTSASTSQYYNFYNIVPLGDVDCTTTDDSELSSDEESLPADDESANANEVDCSFEQSDDNMDDKSYRSWSTTSSTVSVWRKSSSENSETEKSILKEWTPDKPSHNEDKFEDITTPILILVQPPCETEGQMSEIGIDMINVEEHTKRLKELEKELDFIESTEWMYRQIDASIR